MNQLHTGDTLASTQANAAGYYLLNIIWTAADELIRGAGAEPGGMVLGNPATGSGSSLLRKHPISSPSPMSRGKRG